MLKITIIEDISAERDVLLSVLKKWEDEAQITLELSVYASGEEYFQSDHDVQEDLFFLDIKLPGMNGMEVAKRLRMEQRRCQIVFLTAFSEFAIEGYQYHAMNYILKPVTFASVYPTLYEVLDAKLNNRYVFSDITGTTIQLAYDDILYILSDDHVIHIFTATMKYTQKTALRDVLGQLPKTFIRIHRSYIVNMFNIARLNRTVLTLTDSEKTQIPIGRSYIPETQKRFSDYTRRFDRQRTMQ